MDLAAEGSAARARFHIRTHRPGDWGWIVHRHGVLYAQEYGWDERFEALAAGIAADFINNYDASRDRCFVAEMDGELVGSAAVVNAGDGTGKLRVLLVEPRARGMGLGTQLVQECVSFAREAGYIRLRLWTVSNLAAARRVYERVGFRLVGESPQTMFGHGLTDETWELDLGAVSR